MAVSAEPERQRRRGLGGRVDALNSALHRNALRIFLVIVLAHWAEHLTQAAQLYLLGWPLPEARGVLGVPFPWLVTSEWMHYGYALIMLLGFALLRPGFTGTSRTWWNIAYGIQMWHHLEHFLLLIQALTDTYLPGEDKPTSLIELVMPRVELHLFYNTLVTVPMVVAMVLHARITKADDPAVRCACAEHADD
ncbi:hypothetical protein ACX6XY_13815 [Streptomyces sp. O3]